MARRFGFGRCRGCIACSPGNQEMQTVRKVRRGADAGDGSLLPGRAGGREKVLPADPGGSCGGCCHFGNESLFPSEKNQRKEIKGE